MKAQTIEQFEAGFEPWDRSELQREMKKAGWLPVKNIRPAYKMCWPANGYVFDFDQLAQVDGVPVVLWKHYATTRTLPPPF